MDQSPNAPHDKELVRRIIAGEKALFATLLERYEKQVASSLSKLLPERHVQDVAQEVFIGLYDALCHVNADNGLGSFVATLCTRRAHDFWRKAANREAPFSQYFDTTTHRLDSARNIWANVAHNDLALLIEQKDLLNKVLGQFQATDRMLMILVWLEEHTTAEAAKLLGISLPNAKIRVHRCRKKLQKLLCALTEGEQ